MRKFEILSLLRGLTTCLLGTGWLKPDGQRANKFDLVDAIADQVSAPSRSAIAVARSRLEGAPLLRIDAGETQTQETREGVWVRAWIWVEQDALASSDALRLTNLGKRLAQLEPQTRAVFLAYCVEGLSYSAIARRLNLEMVEVQDELAAALVALSAALDEQS
ncbi:sigma-70 region 4 domain-containing protein [Sphingobium yanoikuyae]|uniref:sigma-70 region 4 domain-containing protein n=1 Tax=Sphingobium yanoikuyae TaxID=13690 RepID=UPI0028B1626F|nr:sigma-70 region 4 domain-containing protein [Sphingobium yanoikuyae]